MFWMNKDNKNVIFGDVRIEQHKLCDGRSLVIRPDVLMDFTALPFAANTFEMVVFDPPHLVKLGENSWMALKYGKLTGDWRNQLSRGFAECFRVLKAHGTLIFKWNETQIRVSEVTELVGQDALFGHKRVGKTADTHWLCFIKGLSQ